MATTAAETVTLLKEALASSPGVTELTVDGIRIRISQSALDYWERRAAKEDSPSTRPTVATLSLRGG